MPAMNMYVCVVFSNKSMCLYKGFEHGSSSSGGRVIRKSPVRRPSFLEDDTERRSIPRPSTAGL